MALPSGVATKLVTVGKYYAADGTLSTNWTGSVTIANPLRWTATGDIVEPISMQITRAGDGTGSIRLPITDQAGWVDTSGTPITGWYYTLKVSSTDFTQRDRVFQLPASATDPFDADNVAVGSTVTPPVGSQSYIGSIIVGGVTYTGVTVTLPDAVSGAGTSRVNGITDATIVGKSLMQAADAAAVRIQAGLASVDNTADVNKPISTATAAALAVKANSSDVTTALAAKADAAGTTAALAGKMSATAAVPVYATKVSGSWQLRPAGAMCIWISPDGTNPPGGGTVAGGGGMAPNDVVLLGPSA